MSHELTQRANGFTEMAYVGDKPWHDLGQSLTKGAPIETWRKEAGLDWEALSAVPQYHNRDGLLLPYEGKRVLYRSDNNHPVGLVSDQFKVFQPADCLETFRSLVEGAGWYIHTAGTLRGGSKVWVMASCDGAEASLYKHDRIKLNLLVATALDGSMKTKAKLVSERVVCANTLAVALGEDGDEVSVSHRSEFDADEMKDSLGLAVGSFEAFMAKAQELAEKAIGLEQATAVLRQVFGEPTVKGLNPKAHDYAFQRMMAQVKGAELREQRSVERCLSLYQGEGLGSQLKGSVGTAWGLLNSVTQFVDHERGRTDDTRMDSAWFGLGDKAKTQTLELLTAL